MNKRQKFKVSRGILGDSIDKAAKKLGTSKTMIYNVLDDKATSKPLSDRIEAYNKKALKKLAQENKENLTPEATTCQ